MTSAHSTAAQGSIVSRRREGPPGWLLHLGFFFSGLGMLLLGPILPVLAAKWGLQDSRSGMLLGAQFFGAFAGSISLGNDLRVNLLQGCLAAVAGFALFAAGATQETGFGVALLAGVLCGLGLGRITTSISLIAGQRYSSKRGAALSLLNVSWGVGAFTAPLLAGSLLPRLGLVLLFGMFGLAAASIAALFFVQFRRSSLEEVEASPTGGQSSQYGISPLLLVYFALLFLLYGGLESSIGGWLTTFSMRYAGGTLRTGAYATTALWIGLSGGRVFASLLFLRVPEQPVLLAGIALAGLGTVALGHVTTIADTVLLALAIGLCMAPVFPALCSRLMAAGPRHRQAGGAMAITALGGASIPWLVGALSQRWGSLQLALLVPALVVGLLFVLAAARSGHSERPC